VRWLWSGQMPIGKQDLACQDPTFLSLHTEPSRLIPSRLLLDSFSNPSKLLLDSFSNASHRRVLTKGLLIFNYSEIKCQ
jgi:hypothetical protein